MQSPRGKTLTQKIVLLISLTDGLCCQKATGKGQLESMVEETPQRNLDDRFSPTAWHWLMIDNRLDVSGPLHKGRETLLDQRRRSTTPSITYLQSIPFIHPKKIELPFQLASCYNYIKGLWQLVSGNSSDLNDGRCKNQSHQQTWLMTIQSI